MYVLPKTLSLSLSIYICIYITIYIYVSAEDEPALVEYFSLISIVIILPKQVIHCDKETRDLYEKDD